MADSFNIIASAFQGITVNATKNSHQKNPVSINPADGPPAVVFIVGITREIALSCATWDIAEKGRKIQCPISVCRSRAVLKATLAYNM